jgi:4-amino-4-deoxy-L-arabinose transferase-like glycosyltransferase
MTAVDTSLDEKTVERPARRAQAPRRPTPPRRYARLAGWLRTRRLSLAVVAGLLVPVGLVNAWNLHGWPGRINDDEATYVAQAWAMTTRGDIAHYTYVYDHPFLGWAMIAGYALVTNGFDRAPSAIMVGREFMLLTLLVSCALMFLLARRLGFHRITAAVAVLIFGLSPLAVFFHRMAFLDNPATMFVLAALTVAASTRRSMAAAFWSAVCMAAATLTKETAAILLPALIWVLLQHTHRRTRMWNIAVFITAYGVLVASYPMYALLKSELLPGEGHVSLSWAVWWQLFGREGSGSLFDTTSGTYGLARSWVDTDPWLLLGGVVLIPAGLAIARLRPLAVALLIQVVMMLRGGYLPFGYVTAVLPFAALLVAGVADTLWRARPRWRVVAGRLTPVMPTLQRAPLVAATVAFLVLALPSWSRTIYHQSTTDGSANSRAATRWVMEHVPRDAVVVTDDYIWMDLTLAGFTKPVWLFKVDTDPEVMDKMLPDGYPSIQYIVLARQSASIMATIPTLQAGIEHSERVAVYGEIEIRRVRH